MKSCIVKEIKVMQMIWALAHAPSSIFFAHVQSLQPFYCIEKAIEEADTDLFSWEYSTMV